MSGLCDSCENVFLPGGKLLGLADDLMIEITRITTRAIKTKYRGGILRCASVLTPAKNSFKSYLLIKTKTTFRTVCV